MKVGDLVTYKGKVNPNLRGMIGVITSIGKGSLGQYWSAQVLFPSYSPDPVHIRVDHLRAVP